MRAGVSTFLVAALASFAAMAVFFGPDFVLADDVRREGFTGFFVGFLVVGALLVASIAGLMKALASWRWEFDWRSGVVRRATRTTFGHRFADELDLARVADVVLTRADGALGAHALTLCLDDGSRAVVVRSRGSLRELEALQAQLSEAVAHVG